MANARTVNLSHLASQFPGTALHASNYRRLQRLFQHIRLDEDVVVHRYLRVFGVSSIEVLLAGREFIGNKGLEFLMKTMFHLHLPS
ncbi:hypothetical protein [Nitratireductor sp. XY-223]|uniref:hypothetical protein n=1 Tax=Nitratireductor sp. XY-223 TaxID=2561926 RepID=UPI0010AB4C7D|nr:hypothetical protein [Nitratireductor sp. XY-223]